MSKDIGSFYIDVCRGFSDRPLFNSSMTYIQILGLARSRAVALQEHGIRPGMVVGLLAGNSPEWCVSFMAITSIGAVALLLDTNLSTEKHGQMLQAAGCKHIFVSKEFERPFPGVEIFPSGLDNLSERRVDELKPEENGPFAERLAALFFTSGTTSEPKIVGLTQANLTGTVEAALKRIILEPGMNILAMLPLYHVYGLLANFLALFAAGCNIHFQTSLRGPDILATLSRINCQAIPAVPQLWELFFDGIVTRIKERSEFKFRFFMIMLSLAPLLRKVGLGIIPRWIFQPIHDIFGRNLIFLLSGGAPLKKKILRNYRAMGFTLIEGYGLTETTGPVCISELEDKVPGSVGRPLEGNQVEIRRPNSEGIGEIWLKGISVMPGYYQNTAANREVFDTQGWFNSGDLGYLDKHSSLHITGRVKNIIVLDSGKNVYPEELEEYYLQCAEIAELAVFGRKNAGKETVYAVIVPRIKNKKSYQLIKEKVQEMNKGLPGYKVISGFALSFEPLPRNSARKVVIREVVKFLEAGKYQVSAEKSGIPLRELRGGNAREEAVLLVLKEFTKREILFTHYTFSDLEIDSLKLITLIVHLEEQLNITIDADRVINCTDLEELVRYLAVCPPRAPEALPYEITSGPLKTKVNGFFNPVVDLLLLLIGLISKVCWRLHVIHPERLLVENDLIVLNHQSFLDILWLLSCIPRRQRKNIYLLGLKELWFFAWLFPGLPVIFVESSGNTISSIQGGADVLRQGKSLVIFPEGSRSFDGKLGEFKIGAAYLAKKLNKKIVPVTINGAFDIFPRQKRFPAFFTKYTGSLTVHDMIDPEKFDNVEDLNNRIKEVIQGGLKTV